MHNPSRYVTGGINQTSKGKTRHTLPTHGNMMARIFLLLLMVVPCICGLRLTNWYQHTKSYSRMCVCSLYSKTYCSRGNCAHDRGCNTPLPNNYIAYHLNGQTINIDGRLDDPAWNQVPWTKSFKDIRGARSMAPKFLTKVKIRWDNDYLYVGAWMEAKEIWGTLTRHDSSLYKENAFEMLYAPDETLTHYKEIHANVLNTTWDLMLTKAYIDGGVASDDWESQRIQAVNHDGTINDASDPGTYWTVEWAIPFSALADSSIRNQSRPLNKEVVFVQFGRPLYHLSVIRGTYQKESDDADWLSWEPMTAVNLHIPSRWGLVQFSEDLSDREFTFPRWHIYKTLFAVFDALVQHKALNGVYSDQLSELPVPRHVYYRRCIELPVINLTPYGFRVRVKSRIPPYETGTILHDRSVSFS